MKSLFKVTLLTAAMGLALSTGVMAADAAKTTDAAATAPAAADAAKAAAGQFKSDEEAAAYALGASLGRYMDNSLKEQEKLGIKLDKQQLIQGVQDAFADKSKLSDEEIEKTLQSFEGRVKEAAQAKNAAGR
ncbi:hypothetical protein OS11_33260 [Dickeya oryzae]